MTNIDELLILFHPHSYKQQKIQWPMEMINQTQTETDILQRSLVTIY